MGPRRSKQWKAFETQVARDFGLRRVPLSGSNSGVTGADCMPLDPSTGKAPIFIECKYRGERGDGKKGWPHAALWYDSKKKAKKEGIPITMVAHGDKHRQGYMVSVHSTQLKEFAKLILEHFQTEDPDAEQSDDAEQAGEGDAGAVGSPEPDQDGGSYEPYRFGDALQGHHRDRGS